jgi:MFS family permease
MERNIKIAYILGFLRNFWLWLGVWVFYYLRFTDYAGIGLVESVMIISLTVAEVPTGAIADLIGKTKTLTTAYLLMAVCNILLALTTQYWMLVVSVLFGGVGLALSSGSYEALIYDSLKQDGKTSLFDKVIANVGMFQLIAMAVGGLLAGLLYTINPALPYWGTGVAYLLGFILTLFLREPQVDTEKFSLRNFVEQNKQGFVQLKRLFKVEEMTWLVIIVSAIWVISDEMMESFLGVEFGFSPQYIGIIFSLVFLVAAGVSKMTPFINRKFGTKVGLLMMSAIMAFTYAISPLSGLILGGITIALRTSSLRVFENLSLVLFNQHIESKYRATVISTYNMFKNLPYVLTAYVLGILMQSITARNFAFIMGISIGLVIVFRLVKRSSYKLGSDRF